MAEPKCFLSYSWDSEDHKNWVRNLATALTESGVLVYLDQWDVRPGLDLPQYMETAIRNSDFVFLICTPAFAEKANLGKGGVGYEKSIVTGEVFNESASKAKFVPVLSRGTREESLPSYLKSRAFVDFRNNEKFTESLEELLRHIYDQPRFKRPAIGTPPSFGDRVERTKLPPQPASKPPGLRFDLDKYKEIYEFARSHEGMGFSSSEARKWADENAGTFGEAEFLFFKKIFLFTSDYENGLGLYRSDAAAWATKAIKILTQDQMEEFHRLFSFGKSYEGLGLSREDAYMWAVEKLGVQEEIPPLER